MNLLREAQFLYASNGKGDLREAQFLYASNGKGDHEAAKRVYEILDQDPFLPSATHLKMLVLLVLLEQDRATTTSFFNAPRISI